MDTTFISKGIELVNQAVAADKEKDLKAVNLYNLAVSQFLTGLPYISNEALNNR